MPGIGSYRWRNHPTFAFSLPESPYFSTVLKMRDDAWTTLAHTTPESKKSAIGYEEGAYPKSPHMQMATLPHRLPLHCHAGGFLLRYTELDCPVWRGKV